MRQTSTELVRRHEILRTRFVIAGDEPRQEVAPTVATAAVVDVDGDSAAARAGRGHAAIARRRGAAVRSGARPVLRATL